MTYRQYLETCNDEFERTIIIANLARKHPNYDSYSARRKKEVQKELLDSEMPIIRCTEIALDNADTIIEADAPKRKEGIPLEENDSGYDCENWIP